jgi:hypothetical protein
MKKELCPITGLVMDCNICTAIKDKETCILWEPEEYMSKWAIRLGNKIRKVIKK